MGKIKSAREIALEKINKIPIDKDLLGGKSQDNTQYLKAAEILAHSFINGKTDVDHIIESVERYPAESREAVAKVFMRYFAGEINTKNTGDILTVLRRLSTDKALLDACDQVATLLEKFLADATANAASFDAGSEEGMRQILKNEGISGTAIYSLNIKVPADSTLKVTKAMEEEYFIQLSGFRSFLEWQS